jgi:hypothetical protein
MINVWIPVKDEFYKYRDECKELYEKLQDKIGDDNSFDFISKNTFFYLFENDGILIGAIYYFKKDGNWFLNGFAKRKMHNLFLSCLKKSLTWFKGRVYAEAQNRASALCLLRCGFKRVNGNRFVISI